MAKFGKVDKAVIVKHYIELNVRHLRTIFESNIIPAFMSEKKRIHRIKTDNERYLEDLGDELSQLENNLTTISNIFCVALYSQIESLLNMLGKHLDKKWKETYRWEDIKRTYKENGIYLSKLPKYDVINVIREINNCVKHSDSIVTKNLQNVSNKFFVHGTRLKVETAWVLSYFDVAETFLYALVDIIKSLGRYDQI